jgi:hypothetical protein
MSVEMRFWLTLFRDYGAGAKWERKTTLSALAEKISEVTRSTKDELPWLKLACFGDKRTAKGSLRHDANIKWVSGVEADYDASRVTFGEAVELVEKLGLMSIVYTSPGHTEDLPRWRILAPFSMGLPPDQRGHHLGRLNGAFRGIFARESWTLSQCYYFGSVAGNPSHRVAMVYGHTIDQLDELDECWIGPPGGNRGADSADASAEAREDAELIRSAITGEHLHVELCALAARYIGRGIPAGTVADLLRGVMLAQPEPARGARWTTRYDNIGKLVRSAAQKFGGEQIAARRAVARETWKLAEQNRPGEEIRAAVLATAERLGLAPDRAINIAAGILREVMKEPRHA